MNEESELLSVLVPWSSICGPLAWTVNDRCTLNAEEGLALWMTNFMVPLNCFFAGSKRRRFENEQRSWGGALVAVAVVIAISVEEFGQLRIFLFFFKME